MIFTSVLLALLVCSILLISHWSANKGIAYLIIVIILFSIRQFIFILINSDAHVELLAILLIHLDPFFFLAGPFFLYYLKSLVHGKFVVDKYLLVFAIPALIAGINTLPYYNYPFAEKVAESAAIQGNYFLSGPVNFQLLFFPFKYQLRLAALYNLSFALFSFIYLIRIKKNSSIQLKKKVSVLLNRILMAIALVIVPNLIVLLYALVNSPKKGELIFRQAAFEDNGAVFFMTLLLPLSFFLVPSWLYNDQASANPLDKIQAFLQRIYHRTPKAKVVPQDSEKSEDLERILAYLETKRPYLQVSFSLHDLSLALNIPHSRATTCFNKELNTSFPTYRNKLRVAHAISLLRQGAYLRTSIEGIAIRSGFKSKSIFYAAFKEEYGMTPTDWMKINL